VRTIAAYKFHEFQEYRLRKLQFSTSNKTEGKEQRKVECKMELKERKRNKKIQMKEMRTKTKENGS